MILDVMLPDFDGLEVMRRMRAAGIDAGVVFLSARDTPADKIAGLTAGGDDYVTKPFGLEELAARVSAVLRRVRPETDADEVLRVADLELNPVTYQVTRAGADIDLAPTEYKMLRYLMVNANVVLSRSQLLDAVWGTDFYGDDSVVATYISYLRRKVDLPRCRPADPHPPGIRLRAPRAAALIGPLTRDFRLVTTDVPGRAPQASLPGPAGTEGPVVDDETQAPTDPASKPASRWTHRFSLRARLIALVVAVAAAALIAVDLVIPLVTRSSLISTKDQTLTSGGRRPATAPAVQP